MSKKHQQIMSKYNFKFLDFDKPKKLRLTKDHNEMYQSDCGVAGTYISNMSKEDECRFKCKYVGGKKMPRVEIRRRYGGCNVVIIVYADKMKISLNGSLYLSFSDWKDIEIIVVEAMIYLEEMK